MIKKLKQFLIKHLISMRCIKYKECEECRSINLTRKPKLVTTCLEDIYKCNDCGQCSGLDCGFLIKHPIC